MVRGAGDGDGAGDGKEDYVVAIQRQKHSLYLPMEVFSHLNQERGLSTRVQHMRGVYVRGGSTRAHERILEGILEGVQEHMRGYRGSKGSLKVHKGTCTCTIAH